MKKIGFALQVFTLITILPLYVVVEMNHDPLPSIENESILKIKDKSKTPTNLYLQTTPYPVHLHYSEAGIKASGEYNTVTYTSF